MSFAGRKQCLCYTNGIKPTRQWVVVQRKENRSNFNVRNYHEGFGYSGTPAESIWSHVICLTCGAHWRTRGKYVDRLPDLFAEGRPLCYSDRLRQGRLADPKLLETLKAGQLEKNVAPRSRGYVVAGKNVAPRPRRKR